MNESPTIVIVGGVAGGASAAARARRMNERANIVLFEKDEYVSFANCGLPYYLGGEIADRDRLLVATPEFLARRFRLDVRARHEVTAIDREAKEVTVVNHRTGETLKQRYDKLILAPGAAPLVPDVPGADCENVLTLRNLEDTDRIAGAMEVNAGPTVVVGAGYIGLEVAEQFQRRGLSVTVVELQTQILPLFDAEMVQPLQMELQNQGVALHLGNGIAAIEKSESGRAATVVLQDGTRLPAGLVILAIGVRPQVELAERAGLEIGSTGGIRVNRHLQTSDPDIYAVGDAVEYVFGPTGQCQRIPLAGPANRAGRLAGEHAATGRSAPMSDVMGTAIVRVFGQTAAMTGLTQKAARRSGVDARSVTIVAAHHAGYYPGATPLTLKLTYAEPDGRILGAQAVGANGVDKRIDVIATAMGLKATVRDLAGVDLAYAPPFGSAKDPVHLAAFAACNQLDGIEGFLDADADLSGMQVVDVRTAGEVARSPLPGVDHVIHIPVDELRERIGELDPNRPTVVSCGVGLRAHVAACILRQHGFAHVDNLSGGAMVRYRTDWAK